MRIQFLGTGASEGFPGLYCNCQLCQKCRELGGKNLRSRRQTLIDEGMLIDFPADTCMRVLAGRLDLPHIYNCIITHSHGDHFYPRDVEMRYP
ncbi:MAG: carbon-phosphorus lyase, partial [Clostridia bacterium]|nr:carbon-phosphorus lyase [Clostridia bacterium]